MRYIFFGTPEFAAIILGKLVDAGMPPAVVVCNPDRPVGRKKVITPPPTKVLAEKHKIPAWQPGGLEIRNWKLEIEKLGGVELAIVAAYNKIISTDIMDSLPAKFLGVHPSLLPKYRGPTPIQTALLNGERKTGVTLFLLDEKVDHGPILAQRELEFSIFFFQFSNLLKALANLSADLLIEILPKFTKGAIKPRPQNEAEATYTKKFSTEDALVDLEKDDPVVIDRKIRALNPEPGVWTLQKGKRVKLLEAELVDGVLKLKKIQVEGRKPTFLKHP